MTNRLRKRVHTITETGALLSAMRQREGLKLQEIPRRESFMGAWRRRLADRIRQSMNRSPNLPKARKDLFEEYAAVKTKPDGTITQRKKFHG